MAKKSRLPLIIGFVSVIENEDIHPWFPRVVFYDDRGSMIIAVPQDLVCELYKALKILADNDKEKDGTIISSYSGQHYLSWYKGTVSLFKSSDDMPSVVINIPSAKQIINLIETM